MSFHINDWTRTAGKCTILKNVRAKRAKLLFFVVKYATVLTMLSPLSLRLLKPSNIRGWVRPFLVGGVVWYQGR